ncbi:MAG TPA: FAD-binding oxidoreductase [Gaiellaceae bacterium]|nr:FAD-binding oxidoreductase [Gaiellaceae bacterium]
MSVGIVGAGISGLSIAVHALDRGLGPVTLYDAAGVGAGASSIQPGGVRQQWGTVANCLMARESRAYFGELADRLGVEIDARFDRCDYVFVADREESLAQLAANVEVQREAGVPSELLGPAALERLVPGLRGDAVAGGAHCAEDGYFDRPQAVVAAFAAAAKGRGATVERAFVRELTRDGGGWRIVCDGTTGAVDTVVVAASDDSARLVAPLGRSLPIVREPRFLFFGEPRTNRWLDPLVIAIDRGVAAKQLADGRLLASDLRATGEPEATSERWRQTVRDGFSDLVPAVAADPLAALVQGHYDMTPDAQPIVDEVADGLWVAAGFSGHGFMVAPSTGRLVGAALAGEALPAWHASVRLGRFEAKADRDTQVI